MLKVWDTRIMEVRLSVKVIVWARNAGESPKNRMHSKSINLSRFQAFSVAIDRQVLVKQYRPSGVNLTT